MATDSTHQIPAFLRRRPASLSASADASGTPSPTTNTSSTTSSSTTSTVSSSIAPAAPTPTSPRAQTVHVSKLPSTTNTNTVVNNNNNFNNTSTTTSTTAMPLPELPRSQSVDNRLPPSDSALPPTPPLPVTLPTALPAMPATPTPTTVPQTALASAAAPPPLDVNTIVFLQQQLERVVAFMRTVDARLDSLERTTLHLVSQQERLNKQLEVRQQRPVTSTLLSTSGGLASGGGGGGAMETGGICPLCGLHFPDSNELQMHAQTCLDKRESRDRRSSSTGGAGASSNQGKDGGIFGRFLGKH